MYNEEEINNTYKTNYESSDCKDREDMKTIKPIFIIN